MSISDKRKSGKRMKLEREAEKKREELQNIIKSSFSQFNIYIENIHDISQKIIEKFTDITPPEIDITIHLITMEHWSRGARSSKPGNIWLNWRKLLIDGAESILTITGAAIVPWLIPLAGLIVWNKVWSLLNIEIDERHAVVIWVMWRNRDKENCIKEREILDAVNDELKKYNRPEMSPKELEDILKDLEKMECIEKIQDENKWWLREWVKVAYE